MDITSEGDILNRDAISSAVRPRRALTGILFTALLFVVASLFLKNGRLPAASRGDEIWWSESAYWVLNGKGLVWGIFADEFRNAQHSFYPPIAPLLQAAIFAIGGLSQYTIYLPATLVTLAVLTLTYLLGQRLGLSLPVRLLTPLALLGWSVTERSFSQVRMETLIPLFYLGFILCLPAFNPTWRWPAILRAWLGGVCIGVACLCYYPQSPFVLLSACIMLGWLRVKSLIDTRYILWFGAGGFTVLTLFCAWIHPHYSAFINQLTYNGAAHGLITPRVSWMSFVPSIRLYTFALYEVTIAGLVSIFLLIKYWRGDPRLTALCFAVICQSAVIFLYSLPLQAVTAIVLFTIVLGMVAHQVASAKQRIISIGLATLAVLACFRQAIGDVTVIHQWEMRDYAAVEANLRAARLAQGKVAISNTAWLGLRPHLQFEQLHFLPFPTHGDTGPAFLSRSLVLRDPQNLALFDYFVVESDLFEALQQHYPILKAAAQSKEFRMIEIPRENVKPLPWSSNDPYRLTMLERVKPVASEATGEN